MVALRAANYEQAYCKTHKTYIMAERNSSTSTRSRTRKTAAVSAAESEVSNLVVVNKTFKAKVLDIKKQGNFVTLRLNSKQVLYARERTESGMVLDSSAIQPRETEYISVSIPDLHKCELGIGFKIVRLINRGRIDEVTLVALFNSWLTIKVTPFAAGDNFVGRNGETLVHQHDGQVISIISADLDADSVKEAKEMAILGR